MEETKEIFLKAELAFGKEQQLLKVVEELSELSQALVKLIIADKPTKELYAHVFEETADVEIMIAQMKRIFECENEVEVFKNAKLKRLSKIVEDKLNWGKKP